MGFFGKIFKGIKKGFKKIGKGIKTAFKSFGKFMGKIGILGQIAMMFILPVVGGALMSGLGSAFSGLVGSAATTTAAGTGLLGATGSGIVGTLARGAGTVLKAAGNFVSTGANVFRNVTEGVTNFIGNFSKTAANKLSSTLGFEKLPFSDAASNFFGSGDSAWARSTNSFSNRMSNLTGSKDFIKGLDEDFIKGLDGAAIEMSPTAPSTIKKPAIVTPDIAKATKQGLSTMPQQSLLEPPVGSAIVTPDISEATSFGLGNDVIPDGSVGKVMEDASDTSWWDDAMEAVENTKATVKDEFKNFGSNTIKKVAETGQDIVPRAILTKVDQELAEDQPSMFQSSGGAQFQMASVGSGDVGGANPNAYQVDYGVNAGAMPYGYNAAQAGYFSFLNSSLSGTRTG